MRSTSSSSTSITTSGRALSMALMTRAAAAMRSGESLIVIALVAGMPAMRRASIDDAQQVDRLLEIRVAQVERADDLFLVLASLCAACRGRWSPCEAR